MPALSGNSELWQSYRAAAAQDFFCRCVKILDLYRANVCVRAASGRRRWSRAFEYSRSDALSFYPPILDRQIRILRTFPAKDG